jgi:hypothetical protein
MIRKKLSLVFALALFVLTYNVDVVNAVGTGVSNKGEEEDRQGKNNE